jgi:hypothetical protein
MQATLIGAEYLDGSMGWAMPETINKIRQIAEKNIFIDLLDIVG